MFSGFHLQLPTMCLDYIVACLNHRFTQNLGLH